MANFMSLIIARLDGEKIYDSQYSSYIEGLVRDGIGGFIVFGGEYEAVKDFIVYLQSISAEPLIIASDIERGVGQQIKGCSLMPSQMGIAAGFDLVYDREELEALYSIVIREAAELGINLALIPVLDVNTEPENPIICTRAFSDDPEIVSDYGRFVINFFKNHGIMTCGKHFPGHGSTKIDSHLELPEISESIDIHLKPFKKAVKSVPSVMVGHLLIPELDVLPASLSERVINGLLRQKLGFQRTILTDAMNMKALTDYQNSHCLALKAGADLILHPEDPYKAFEEIKSGYKKGFIDEKRIKEALRRIKRLKSLASKSPITQNEKIKSQNTSILIHNAFKKTVTVLKNELKDLNSLSVLPYLAGDYNDEIKQAFENYFGSAHDLKNYKPSGSIPLIAVFTSIKAATSAHKLTEQQNIAIKKILYENPAIFVSFGNPYVVRPFKEAKTIVLVYDSHEYAVLAFLDVFQEGLKNLRKPPVKIEWTDE